MRNYPVRKLEQEGDVPWVPERPGTGVGALFYQVSIYPVQEASVSCPIQGLTQKCVGQNAWLLLQMQHNCLCPHGHSTPFLCF